MTTSIILCGVGGQGILLAARIIAGAAEYSGFDVCSNELHGMAQRGGSVLAQIRFGEKVYSPLVLEGTADALLSLEVSEAVRYAHYLKPGGLAAVSTRRVVPVTVTAGMASYPAEIEDTLRRLFANLHLADAEGIAQKLGNPRLSNTLLTGVLSNGLPHIGQEAWHNAIRTSVKPATVEQNIQAFEYGRNLQ